MDRIVRRYLKTALWGAAVVLLTTGSSFAQAIAADAESGTVSVDELLYSFQKVVAEWPGLGRHIGLYLSIENASQQAKEVCVSYADVVAFSGDGEDMRSDYEQVSLAGDIATGKLCKVVPPGVRIVAAYGLHASNEPTSIQYVQVNVGEASLVLRDLSI